MKVLIIDPLHNSPGMHDDTGAFEPGAEHLAKAFGEDATRFSFDNTESNAFRFAALRSFVQGKSFDALIEVSHGLHNRLQSGIHVGNAETLLADFASPPKVAVLFACSAASSPIESSVGFQFARLGLEVLAHTTVGHAYFNPHVVDIRPVGGFPSFRDVVVPGAPAWWQWIRRLRHGGWIELAQYALGAFVPPSAGFARDVDGFVRFMPAV